jgi:hypothetical protein
MITKNRNDFDPIYTLLDIKREIKATIHYISASLGDSSGWNLEKTIVKVNELHEWIRKNYADVEF